MSPYTMTIGEPLAFHHPTIRMVCEALAERAAQREYPVHFVFSYPPAAEPQPYDIVEWVKWSRDHSFYEVLQDTADAFDCILQVTTEDHRVIYVSLIPRVANPFQGESDDID